MGAELAPGQGFTRPKKPGVTRIKKEKNCKNKGRKREKFKATINFRVYIVEDTQYIRSRKT